jgi:hypothetical protein
MAEGGEGQERDARFEAEEAGHLRARLGDVGEVLLVRPFADERVADDDDPALVENRGHADRAMFGIGVEDVVDEVEHMGRLARGPGHQRVAVAVGEHQRPEDVAVAGGEAVDVVHVEAAALEAAVEEVLVGVEMGGVGGIHHLELAHGIGEALGGELVGHVRFAADDERLAEAIALVGDGGAQDAGSSPSAKIIVACAARARAVRPCRIEAVGSIRALRDWV